MAEEPARDDAPVNKRLADAIPAMSVTTERRRTRTVETARAERIWPIVAKAWPYLNRYISGRWRHFGSAALPEFIAPAGLLFMPVLLTALYGLWVAAGHLAPLPTDTPAQHGLLRATGALGLIVVLLGWTCWALKGRGRVVAAIALVILALLSALSAWIGPMAIGGKLIGVGMFLSVIAGWAARVRLGRDRGVSLRSESHVIYYYMLSFVSAGSVLITSLFTVDIFYTGILAGRPLRPGLAALLGHPEFARGVDFMGENYLTAAMRHTLQWEYLGIALTVWFVLTLPFLIALPYYAIWIQQNINQNLRLDLLERWTRLSPRYHTEHRVGDSIYRIVQDSSGIVNIIARLYLGATQVSGIVQALFLVCFFDWRIAMLGLGMMVVMSLFAWWYSPRLKARTIAAREATSDLTSSVQEILTGVRVTKAYRQETREQQRFEKDSVTSFDSAFRARWLFTVTGVVSFMLVGAFLLPSDFLSSVWANDGRPVAAAGLVGVIGLSFTTWNLAAFRWVGSQMDGLAQRVRGVNTEWAAAQDNTMALRRVFEILEPPPEIVDPPQPAPIQGFNKEIRFENVSFAYEADRPVLKDISFTVEPGTVTAIVGPTGSGKSTLMAMLLRVFDPDVGRITIDGVDLRDFAVEELREQIAVAPQEPILFAQSVLENVRYAAPDVSQDEVRTACEVACAGEFIDDMPQGIETMLGDRGAGLSPGQKQRLCIARAVVRGAPIIILDEPTAPLDAETEHRVMANLAQWGAGKAIFVITHRLSTVRRADHILFLEDGKLSERGSHSEMMAKAGGRYRAMVDAELALAERGVVA